MLERLTKRFTGFLAAPFAARAVGAMASSIGRARGASNSALGEFSADVYWDNIEDWSGDHGMDHETVPGVLLTSRPLLKPAASLTDLAAAIVAEFGVEEFPVR